MSENLLKKYIEWDIPNWSRAIKFWRNDLNVNLYGIQHIALEIGGRRGGLSYFLANEIGCRVICSDLRNPKFSAKPLHDSYNCVHNITYSEENCLELSYEDEKFDIIIFKSVIGALGNSELQRKAIEEMWRCLKPGGKLLFAENSKASFLHQISRKHFTAWNHYWYYPTLKEMEQYLSIFSIVKIRSTGFLSLFFRNENLNFIFSCFDGVLDYFIPRKLNYIIYGVAIK